MNNKSLRLYAASRGVRLWEIAEKFHLAEATFSKRMRKEFSEEDAERFRNYVDEIASVKGV